MGTEARRDQLAEKVLARWGGTIPDELGIDLRRDGPSGWFRLLCASMLSGARIRAGVALAAARGLAEAGWTSAERLAASSWEDRVGVLDGAGYARYDERTATALGRTAEEVRQRYGGDLRRLREEARRDPVAERRLLKRFSGVGDVAVDIFFREAQVAWPELWPFADRRALRAAERLGLGLSAEELAALVRRRDFPRLVSALVRIDLERAYEQST